MILPLGVKTIQHPKAMGNARTAARGFMVPIFRPSVGPDVVTDGSAATDYGPERYAPGAAHVVDELTLDGIVAFGRLEALGADGASQDVRLTNKEAYRLYWLPASYSGSRTDHSSNPINLGAEINPSAPQEVERLHANTRVWIVLDSAYVPGKSDLSALNGAVATEFVVLDVFNDATGDLVEFGATVVRSEGSTRMVVSII